MSPLLLLSFSKERMSARLLFPGRPASQAMLQFVASLKDGTAFQAFPSLLPVLVCSTKDIADGVNSRRKRNDEGLKSDHLAQLQQPSNSERRKKQTEREIDGREGTGNERRKNMHPRLLLALLNGISHMSMRLCKEKRERKQQHCDRAMLTHTNTDEREKEGKRKGRVARNSKQCSTRNGSRKDKDAGMKQTRAIDERQ